MGRGSWRDAGATFEFQKKIEGSKDRQQKESTTTTNSAERSKDNVWEEVVAVSENSWEDFKTEALRIKALLEKDVVRAIEKGPIVKFLDKDRQARMIKGEEEHMRFIANNLDWIDPNVQAMAMEDDNEGIRMASNQIHY
ncbi:hypothetical protein POM88_008727 [Heracleum sosnowskyi]|uniref:Uncharacterized protein n=1 Tax=Heracleum sosnowskyi TaxID=360622 RepID=A0AAD8J8I6_9APIA|nr:hypothetical protein POM88_008727 [Heracleum sosnowskyi]